MLKPEHIASAAPRAIVVLEEHRMKLGVGLPGYLGGAVGAATVLDWARGADSAGFHGVAVHDRPCHDAWDPLTTLVAAAAVTERVRLATTVVLAPAYDEGLLARQAAVVDQVSGGRLDLGVGLGARAEDYQALGRSFERRGARLSAQLGRLHELWASAVEHEQEGGVAGPAPVQRPHPPLWVGGYADAAIGRAVRFGDGYLFGAPGVDVIAAKVPAIREAAERAGRGRFPIGALAYVALSTDPAELAEGERLLKHYYGSLRKPFPQMVHCGDAAEVGEALDAYRRAGLDVLYLFPVLPSPAQLDRWAEELLSRVAATASS
jgi:alkanesulfonate monooxygenase SsuD/methylene tetrahydromethanopterin reductase-like flavin-dependent oxidoreductase (luciferase family)